MYLFSALQGHGTSAWPSASGMPTECTHQHQLAVGAERVEGVLGPMRVMIRIETAT